MSLENLLEADVVIESPPVIPLPPPSRPAAALQEPQQNLGIPQSVAIFCGNLAAKLHPSLFRCPGINEPCIEYESEMLTPKEMCIKAKKDKHKDWKDSIKIFKGTLRNAMSTQYMDFHNHKEYCSGKCGKRSSSPSRKRPADEVARPYPVYPAGYVPVVPILPSQRTPFKAYAQQCQPVRPYIDPVWSEIRKDQKLPEIERMINKRIRTLFSAYQSNFEDVVPTLSSLMNVLGLQYVLLNRPRKQRMEEGNGSEQGKEPLNPENVHSELSDLFNLDETQLSEIYPVQSENPVSTPFNSNPVSFLSVSSSVEQTIPVVNLE